MFRYLFVGLLASLSCFSADSSDVRRKMALYGRLQTKALKVKVLPFAAVAEDSEHEPLIRVLKQFDNLQGRYLSMNQRQRQDFATELILSFNLLNSFLTRVDWEACAEFKEPFRRQAVGLKDELEKLKPWVQPLKREEIKIRYAARVEAVAQRLLKKDDIRVVSVDGLPTERGESVEDYKLRVRQMCNDLNALERDVFLNGVKPQHESIILKLSVEFADLGESIPEKHRTMIENILQKMHGEIFGLGAKK